MVVVGDAGVVIDAVTGPLTCVQAPVPTVAVLAAIVAEPGEAHMAWSVPAFAIVGGALTLKVTLVEVTVAQLLLTTTL